MSIALDKRALGPALGVEVLGVDLASGVDDVLFAAIYDAFLEHQLVLFRDQDLPPARQVEFGRRFGELQVHVMSQYHADGHPELYELSNLDADGNPSGNHPDRGTLAWHTDGSWQAVTGQATIMYAVEVPGTGGETHFCDMYAAHDELPAARRAELGALRAIHNLDFSRSRRHGEDPMTDEQRRAVPPVAHPIVRRHPETGRPCLYLGDHAECVEGMDYDAGRRLVDELNEAIVCPDRVCSHRWRPGDLMAWDNRCLLHRAGSYDAGRERRVMRRCTVLGERPVAAVS